MKARVAVPVFGDIHEYDLQVYELIAVGVVKRVLALPTATGEQGANYVEKGEFNVVKGKTFLFVLDI